MFRILCIWFIFVARTKILLKINQQEQRERESERGKKWFIFGWDFVLPDGTARIAYFADGSFFLLIFDISYMISVEWCTRTHTYTHIMKTICAHNQMCQMEGNVQRVYRSNSTQSRDDWMLLLSVRALIYGSDQLAHSLMFSCSFSFILINELTAGRDVGKLDKYLYSNKWQWWHAAVDKQTISSCYPLNAIFQIKCLYGYVLNFKRFLFYSEMEKTSERACAREHLAWVVRHMPFIDDFFPLFLGRQRKKWFVFYFYSTELIVRGTRKSDRIGRI